MGVTFSACYQPEETTFGVNAKIVCDSSDIWWLLGYLNSSLVTYFVRAVLLRSNMITSGYVSRIPIVPLPQRTKTQIASIAKQAFDEKIENGQAGEFVKQIDKAIYEGLALSEDLVCHIQDFCSDLLRRT